MTEPLKIAFYTDTYLPARDGVVTSILNTEQQLVKKGNEVYTFAAGNAQTRKMVAGNKNITVVRGMKFSKYPQYNLALLPMASYHKQLEINPDIVHAHTPFIMGTWALAFAKIEKIPVVSTFHTMFTDRFVLQEYASKRAAVALEKYSWKYASFFYNRCNAVIAPSNAIKNILIKNGITSDIYVVPNGVDTRRFNSKTSGKQLRKMLLSGEKKKIVLYVGRMSKEKRLETLIRAAKLLKNENIKFVFAGAGPALNYYEHMAELQGIDAMFVGFVDDKLLPQYYAAADAFCLPSTFETQGVVILEAMASGKPVIGADALALSEIIKNGKNGEKFRPNDAKDCASKIRKVINNTSSYKEMTKTANEYSVVRTTDELLNIYRRVINDITV